MSETDTRAKKGQTCPLARCDETVGEQYWVAWGEGSHTYHVDDRGVAYTWEHRDGLTVVPPTEPYKTTEKKKNERT